MASVSKSFSVPMTLLQRLQELADRRGVKLSALVVTILRQAVQDADREEQQEVQSYVE